MTNKKGSAKLNCIQYTEDVFVGRSYRLGGIFCFLDYREHSDPTHAAWIEPLAYAGKKIWRTPVPNPTPRRDAYTYLEQEIKKHTLSSVTIIARNANPDNPSDNEIRLTVVDAESRQPARTSEGKTLTTTYRPIQGEACGETQIISDTRPTRDAL
ncbi:MAG: hypothetical protein COU35_04165 [Candidatus Magasanikbacteria bacterium CG10_big_fil_rev_8_21_14_0_10_47_10]|uniref:Uncharacterized protein n=1 Tax=Candidatus Magasanikbacteria bacterium CG10_big_fil_rev_8_21_14_0_10_47_10 TaxID=1974652 RepID=A0A2H0TPN3_9BACT|nr:MAG: hypothetical protein COU35_04165 [Candidatus Magasanikbacteria bacterium CG10_big_fil_rev_8_21_14_0_10_47_10]